MHSKSRDILIAADDDRSGMAHYASNLTYGLNESGTRRASLWLVEPSDGVETTSLMARALDSNRLLLRLRRYYSSARGLRLAQVAISTFAPSLVHLTSRLPAQIQFIQAMRARRIPVVHTVHDPDPHESDHRVWGRLRAYSHWKYEYPRFLKMCSALHVHSPLHVSALVARYPFLSRDRIYIVSHGGGMTSTMLRGTSRPAGLDRAPQKGKTALFFGRIEPYKGVALLLEAASIVASRIPDFRLVIAGAGRLPLIPTPLQNNVIVINRFIQDEEILALFRASAFVVLPYRTATQTGVVPLASAAGIPAIVTDVGALREHLTNDSGIVVNPDDHLALASAMTSLITNPAQTEAMGRAAHRLLVECYSWPAVASQHAAQYQRLLERAE